MQTFNITSATTTTLRDIHADIGGNVKSIRLTNTHASTAVTVSLFLEDSSSNKFYDSIFFICFKLFLISDIKLPLTIL